MLVSFVPQVFPSHCVNSISVFDVAVIVNHSSFAKFPKAESSELGSLVNDTLISLKSVDGLKIFTPCVFCWTKFVNDVLVVCY